MMKIGRIRNLVSVSVIICIFGTVSALPICNDDYTVKAFRKKIVTVNKAYVTFNANSGVFTAKKNSGKTFFTVTKFRNGKYGNLPGVKRKGYTFKGWYKKRFGGKAVSSNNKIINTKVLYAHWEKI